MAKEFTFQTNVCFVLKDKPIMGHQGGSVNATGSSLPSVKGGVRIGGMVTLFCKTDVPLLHSLPFNEAQPEPDCVWKKRANLAFEDTRVQSKTEPHAKKNVFKPASQQRTEIVVAFYSWNKTLSPSRTGNTKDLKIIPIAPFHAKPEETWYSRGNPIQHDSKNDSRTDCSILIENVSSEAEGNWTCEPLSCRGISATIRDDQFNVPVVVIGK